MSQPESDETLVWVADELAAMSERLSDLSGTLRVQATRQAQPLRTTEPEPQEPVTPEPEQPPEAPETQEPPESVVSQAAPADIPPHHVPEQRWAAGRVLAWIGGAVTLLGVVFLLVLAAQRGWLSPAFRVTGGAVLGVALVGIGHRVHSRPADRAGGYALAATGFATLYLATVAATALYGYLPVAGGLGAGLLVAAGGLLLADRWQAQPLAVGAVLGCVVCSPLITRWPSAALIGFLVLLQVAATPVQLRHGWSRLTVTAALPAVVAALITEAWALTTGMWTRLPAADHLAIVAAVSTAAALGVVLATITARARPHDGTTIGVLVASPVPALLAAPLLERTAAGFLATGVAALLLALWVGARFLFATRVLLPARFVAVTGGAGAVAALQATMTFLDSSVWATALLCEALLLTLGAWRLRSSGVLLGALCYAVIGFCLAQLHDIPPTVLLGLSSASGVSGVLVGLLTTAAAVAIPAAAYRLGVFTRLPDARPLWLIAGIILLYGTSSATMALVLLAREDRVGFLAGHVLITLSWVLAAIVLLLRGIRVPEMRMAGTVLLAVSLAKLFLFDLATLDGFARVVAFLCTGLVLLAAGVRYARLITESSSE